MPNCCCTTLLILLAGAGWIIFIAGFGALNTEKKFFEQQETELLFLPYNSHYIVATLSPLLFILMVVQSAMVGNVEKRCLVSILSILIYILVGFVLISSGVILHIYSCKLTRARLGDATIAPPLTDIINTIFVGIFIEIIFLILALMTLYTCAVVGTMQQKGNRQGYVEHGDT